MLVGVAFLSAEQQKEEEKKRNSTWLFLSFYSFILSGLQLRMVLSNCLVFVYT